jgi:GNAT superfamily N-acetyltransferase
MEAQPNILPKMEGVNIRFYQGTEDHPALIKHSNRVYEHAEIQERETKDNFDTHYANLRNCNPLEDMILAETNGEVTATARVAWSEQAECGDHKYYTMTATHPDWQGTPLQDEMQAWAMARCHQISAGHPPEAAKFYEEWTAETETAKIAMLEDLGFQGIRFWFEMFRDLNNPIGNTELPEGLEVRAVKPEDYRPIWEAMDEAFRDHWGHVDGTEEDFQRFLNKIGKADGYQPGLWMVAWDGNQVAGMVLNGIFEEENQELDVKRGWTDPICVRRPWRKRGLATALINISLAMLKEIGMKEGALGVDTINPSGALKLYENCGYISHQKTITYSKPFEI